RLAILLNRTLVDGDHVGQDVAVAGVAAREIGPAIEAVERVRRLDPHLVQGIVVRPILDHDRDVLEAATEASWQTLDRPGYQSVEPLAADLHHQADGRATGSP